MEDHQEMLQDEDTQSAVKDKNADNMRIEDDTQWAFGDPAAKDRDEQKKKGQAGGQHTGPRELRDDELELMYAQLTGPRELRDDELELMYEQVFQQPVPGALTQFAPEDKIQENRSQTGSRQVGR